MQHTDMLNPWRYKVNSTCRNFNLLSSFKWNPVICNLLKYVLKCTIEVNIDIITFAFTHTTKVKGKPNKAGFLTQKTLHNGTMCFCIAPSPRRTVPSLHRKYICLCYRVRPLWSDIPQVPIISSRRTECQIGVYSWNYSTVFMDVSKPE